MKHLVVSVVLLMAVSGCDSPTSATISTNAERDSTKGRAESRLVPVPEAAVPDRPSDTESAQPGNIERPEVVDVWKMPAAELFPTGKFNWFVMYKVGPLEYHTVRIPHEKLTEQIIQDYVLKDFEKRQRIEREELEAKKRFEGKKY